MTQGAQRARAWERVRNLCDQHCGLEACFPAWAVMASRVCCLRGGMVLEVGGTKRGAPEEQVGRSKREGSQAVLNRAWRTADEAYPYGRCKQATSVRGDQRVRSEGFPERERREKREERKSRREQYMFPAIEKSSRVRHPTVRSTNRLDKSVRPCGQNPCTESNERTRSRQTAPGMDIKTVGTTQFTNEARTLRVAKTKTTRELSQGAPESPWCPQDLWTQCWRRWTKHGGQKGNNSASDWTNGVLQASWPLRTPLSKWQHHKNALEQIFLDFTRGFKG